MNKSITFKDKPILIILLIFFFITQNFFSAEKGTLEKKTISHKILLLNSYHPGNLFSDEEMEGVKSVFPDNTEFFIEFMDSKRVSKREDYQLLLYRSYKIKYFKKFFDAVISMDDDAFNFLLKYHNELFPDTPVVFCGLNNFNESMIKDDPLITGVVETHDPKSTIDAILKIKPEVKKIYLINDNTTSGIIDRKNFERVMKDYKLELEILNPESGVSLEELLAKLRTLPSDSVVNFLNFHQDKTGEVFLPDKVIPEIVKASKAPIFTQIESFMGSGIVGGKITSGFHQGNNAAKMVQKIFSGIKVKDIKVESSSATKFIFDSKALMHWKIPVNRLPEDSLIINKEESIFLKYLVYIILVFTLIVLQIIVIVSLVINIQRKRKMGKALLIKSEELDYYFTKSLDLLCIIDVKGKFIRINPEWEKVTRYSVVELEGRNYIDFIHQDDIASAADMMINLIKNKKIENFSARFRCKDSSYRWLEWRSFFVEDKFYSVARDITDRKNSEDEALRSAEEWNKTFNVTKDLFMLLDRNYKIIKANKAVSDFVGIQMNEIIGENCYKLIHETQDPDPNCPIYSLEKTMTHQETEIFLSKKKVWLNISVDPIFDKKGNLIEIVHAARDITEKKNIEKLIQESEKKYRELVEDSVLGVFRTTPEGEYIDVNKSLAKIYGFKSIEDLKNSVKDIKYDLYVNPEDRDRFKNILITDGVLKKFEVEQRNQGGYNIWLSINARLIKDYNGKVICYEGTIEDITERKKAELLKEAALEALRKSEERLRLTFDQSPVGEVIVSNDFNFLRVNETFCNFLGFSEKELLSMKFSDVTLPEDLLKDKENIKLLLDGKIDQYIRDKKYKRKDGTTIWGHVSVRCAKDDLGKPLYLLAIIEDISERKVAEEALHNSEERFRALYTNMSEGVAIHETVYDDDKNPVNYRIIDINHQYENILNLEREKIIGKLGTEIYQTDSPPYLKEFTEVGENGVPYFFETYFPPMDKHFAISVAYLQKGKWATIFFDITQRKKAEEERNRLYNFSIDMFCIAGFNGYYKQLNPAWSKNFGWSEEEILSKPWLDFVHPDDKESTIKAGDKLLKGEKTVGFINRFRCKDGTYKWLSWNSFSLMEAKEIFAVVRDVTEQHKSEEIINSLNKELSKRVYERTRELEKANKELESFSYTVSHDLRAPLRHINSYIEILEEDIGGSLTEETRRKFKVVSDSAKRLGDLIDSLLSFSQMNKGELHLVSINMNDLIKLVISDFLTEIKERKINWEISDLPDITGDEVLIRQVWENLISNAIKYTKNKEESIIEIGVHESNGKEIVFFIRDNGVGFDMNYANKLFGVFQRLHNLNEFEGIGIGLANIKRIITRHKGKVWAEGELDKGAAFYISLPM